MVTTRRKKIKLHLASSEGELDGELDVEGPAIPAPKRRKTKQPRSPDNNSAFEPGASSGKGKEKATSDQNQLITRRNGRGGKLRDLMNMPVDIFAEVCSYLAPYDLRRLALTSKRLWDILMTKEARHIWKTAIASIPNLPECPTDLNEPQYITSYFDSSSAIKKAGREYEALSQEQAEDYLSHLKDMYAYQVQTGRVMLQWKENQIASRTHDIAAEKKARFERY
ncbi:hypothetical protein FRC00_014320 [Tulasnella sp. 408]|nr:hypothetical protein FRC00_014320 [Tulasnella sp. 408]